jgi:serine/threonine-protein kinase
MASVYLARDKRLKRLAAIKVLNHELAKDDIGCRRFEREAHAAARISHPNVCHIYMIGRLANDVPYICMEYVEGRDLAYLATSEGPFDVAFVATSLRNLQEPWRHLTRMTSSIAM